MCDSASALLGTCLDAEDSSWAALGYEDRTDYRDACTTWVWEQQLLERDQRRRGDLQGSGHVQSTCEERDTTLTAPDVTCDDYWSIDWRAPAW
ncbi:MAG: hypothetical protein ACI9MC_001581 [Kiritimatiellia bacterium]|jgi:hypothetical protein